MSSFPMIAPNGAIGDVPAERVHEAAAQGFKLGVDMTSPSGQLGTIPMESVHDAISKGFTMKGAVPSEMQNRPLQGAQLPAALQTPQNVTQAGQQLEQAGREGTLGEVMAGEGAQYAKSAEMSVPTYGAKPALQAAGKLRPSVVEAGRKAAGAKLGEITEALRGTPVETQGALKTALTAKELSAGGAPLPQVLSKFLDRMGLGESLGAGGGAIPNKPLGFEEVRAFAKNAGRLSVQEQQNVIEEMKGYVKKFAGEVGDDLKRVAEEHGFQPDYSQALAEYKRAKDIQQMTKVVKKWGIGTILAGLGTAGAGYAARKGYELGKATGTFEK